MDRIEKDSSFLISSFTGIFARGSDIIKTKRWFRKYSLISEDANSDLSTAFYIPDSAAELW